MHDIMDFYLEFRLVYLVFMENVSKVCEFTAEFTGSEHEFTKMAA